MLLRLNGFEIGLDSALGEYNFVSHAHADHIAPLRKDKKVIASDETIELAKARRVRIKAEKFVPDFVELHDAGHVVGAKQIAVNDEKKGLRVVYTGDFKVEKDIFGLRAELLKADVLVLDCTYCDEKHKFKTKEEAYSDVIEWVRKNGEENRNSIIGAYSLGKAQEIIKVLNRDGIVPIVNEEVERINEVYNRLGYSLEYLLGGSEEAEEEYRSTFCAIIPHTKANRVLANSLSRIYGKETHCAVATGWDHHYDVHRKFQLSDHCDFEELLGYVKQSGAKEVYSSHGDAKALRKYGFDVRAVGLGNEIIL